MSKELQGKRFPRAAFARRVDRILDDLAWWNYTFKQRAWNAETPVVEQRCLNRAAAIDEAWHELHVAYATLVGMQ